MISAGENNVDKCLAAQVEEIEVLCSIYGDEWKTENEADRSYSIDIKQGDLSVTLYVTLPETYPITPPTYTLLAPDLKGNEKARLATYLDEVYLQNIGQAVLFQWIDKIREYLSSLVPDKDALEESSLDEVPDELPKGSEDRNVNSIKIVHGEQITDKKSTFQGHVSVVFSIQEVKQILNELMQNKKIAKATHNMYAYRIKLSDDSYIQDCNDDGETNAGGRLLHLLQILNAKNVLVVVSRWYGGILLGPVRFQHINNAARQVLEQAGLLDNKKRENH